MWIFSFFFFLRCKMTPGPGNASVQSPFVSSSAAAWKWQTSHGLAYMLVHTKPIIYLLLLRLKSLVNSFQLELGALSVPSQVRRRCQGRFTRWADGHGSLTGVLHWSLGGRGRGGRGGQNVTGRTGLLIPCCSCWRFTLTPDTERCGRASTKHLLHSSLSLHWPHIQPGG